MLSGDLLGVLAMGCDAAHHRVLVPRSRDAGRATGPRPPGPALCLIRARQLTGHVSDGAFDADVQCSIRDAPRLLSASGTCVVGVWIPCAAELRSILYECGLQNIPRRARARAAAARAPRPPAPSPVQARLQIWLVFIASTTVGYGDIYPVTHAGRIIVIVAALAGVSLASLMAAACSNAIAWSEDQERVLLMLRRRAAQIDLLSKAQARRTPPSRSAPPPRCAAPPPRSAAAPRSGLRWWGVGCDRRVVSCAEERPAPGDEDAPRAARVQGAQGSSSLRPHGAARRC
jgi:hypothetical protein